MIAAAKFRLDSLWYLAPEDPSQWATLTTKRFVLKGNTRLGAYGSEVCAGQDLLLGIDIEVGGRVNVSILDRDGLEIDGYGCRDNVVTKKDSSHVSCAWRGNDGVNINLRPLMHKVVQLRIHIFRAKLYSFKIS